MKGVVAILLLLGGSAWAAVQGEVSFVDACSGQPVSVRSEAGVRLRVSLTGLEAGRPVTIDGTLGPLRDPRAISASITGINT